LIGDVDSAEVEYLRAAIDGEGRYASRARLRLAQLTLARGGHAAAARHLEQLRTDDPGGELTAASWVWTARTAEAAGDVAAACAAWATALPALPDSSPQREEARENRSRCEASGRQPGEVETFTVQLGAFGTEDAAIRLRDGAALSGIAVRVEAPHGGVMVHRVRAGRFGSRDDAERLAARFQAEGYDAVVVPEEP
jgi:cell division septation protein DedD